MRERRRDEAHRWAQWLITSLVLVACGGSPLAVGEGDAGGSAGAGAGGAGSSGGGAAGAGRAGAAGSVGGGAGLAGTLGGTSGTVGTGGMAGMAGMAGTAGAAPVCFQNGETKCEGTKFLSCSNGQFVQISDCKVDGGGKKPICSKNGCIACIEGDIGGCTSAGDGLLVCDGNGHLMSSDTAKCDGLTPYCLATPDPKEAHCVACLTDEQCPDLGNECAVNHCVDNVCTPTYTPADTPTPTQSAEGCSTTTCDGQGQTVTQNTQQNTPCQGKTGYCDGAGACGECLSNMVECVDGGRLRSCSATNQWSDPTACLDTTPACSGQGVCVGLVNAAVVTTHACAVLSDGTVRCWGDNSSGQLGLGPGGLQLSLTPVPVPGLTAIKKVVVGDGFSCALGTQNQVWCWGRNTQGQVGVGSDSASFDSPQPINGTYTDLKAGDDIVCGLTTDKTVWCWGALGNKSGLLSINGVKYSYSTKRKSPAAVGELDCSFSTSQACTTAATANVHSFGVGGDHVCLQSGNSINCFGDNQFGQFGNGKSSNSSQYGSGVVTIAGAHDVIAGALTTAVTVPKDSTVTAVMAWGRNESTYVSSGAVSTPQNPLNIPTGATFFLGDRLTAYLDKGQLTLVGRNEFGQLGNNQTNSSTYEKSTPQLPDVAGLSYWRNTVCAWQTSGKLWCWGANSSGVAGTGSLEGPIVVPNPVKWW